jgi:hypothetical protein
MSFSSASTGTAYHQCSWNLQHLMYSSWILMLIEVWRRLQVDGSVCLPSLVYPSQWGPGTQGYQTSKYCAPFRDAFHVHQPWVCSRFSFHIVWRISIFLKLEFGDVWGQPIYALFRHVYNLGKLLDAQLFYARTSRAEDFIRKLTNKQLSTSCALEDPWLSKLML